MTRIRAVLRPGGELNYRDLPTDDLKVAEVRSVHFEGFDIDDLNRFSVSSRKKAFPAPAVDESLF